MLILVVEDDDALRGALVELLQVEGHLVRGVRDGADALDALTEQDPDLILLDMNMPRVDGHEFLARQQQDRRHARVPVVVMSADERPDDVLPSSFIAKPFDPPRLLDAVAKAAMLRP